MFFDRKSDVHIRISYSQMFCKIVRVLENTAKITGKNLRRILFYIKLQVSHPATLSKKKHWYKCFPVNFAKLLRTHIF